MPPPQVARALATVVVIAPTQSGKSKTIDELYTSQGQPRPSERGLVQVGTGKLSKTTSSKLLPAFHAKYFELIPWDRASKDLRRKMGALSRKSVKGEVTPACGAQNPAAAEAEQGLSSCECEALRDYRAQWKNDKDWKASVKLGEDVCFSAGAGQEQQLSLQFLDTPGLDDSSARDDEHMENILAAMAAPEVSHVIAFVVIAKNGRPFSNSFFQSLQRYWYQFPSFRHNWVFVHTAMDPAKTDYEDDGDEGCFEQEQAERRRLLVECMQQTCEGEVEILPKLPHVFVDNVVPDAARVAKDPSLHFGLELKKYARAESYNTLLMSIASNRPVEVKELPYFKSEAMQQVDRTLIGQFLAYKKGLLETLRTIEHRHSKLMGKYTEAVEQSANKRARREQLVRDICELDTTELVVNDERQIDRPWKLFGNDCWETVQSKIKIAHKSVTCTGSTNVEDKDIVMVGETYVWNVRVSSPPLRGCGVILKIYVEKRRKEAKMIKQKQRDREALDRDVASAEAREADLREEIESAKQKIGTLKQRIEWFTQEAEYLGKPELAFPKYMQLKDFYREVSRQNINEGLMLCYFKAMGMLAEFDDLQKQ